MKVAIRGAAICGAGVPDWATAVALLRGEAALDRSLQREPAPLALPPNERRRLPASARIALGIGIEALQAAGLESDSLPTVFTSCGSDGPITHQICDALARPLPEMSPTRFHNSVHNAPGGYWSIALGSRAPSTSVCAHAGSFAAGLLEAATQALFESRAVLLIAYDLPYPAPLASLWTVSGPCSAALVLAPAADDRAAPTVELELTDDPLSPWPDLLPAELATHPAAVALTLVGLLSDAGPSRAVLPYHAGTRLGVSRA